MATYTRDYPALERETSEIGDVYLRGTRAPAVVAGTKLDDALLQAAFDESAARQFHARHGRVTQKEAMDARLREHALLNEHAVARYGGRMEDGVAVAAPLVLGVEVNVVLQPLVQQLHRLRGDQQREAKNLRREIESLRHEVLLLKNSVRKAKNQLLFKAALRDQARRNDRLHRYVKVSEAGIQYRYDNVYGHAPVRIGEEYPSPPFPRTVADLERMTVDHIVQLAVLMKDDFGIVGSDDIVACRIKVRRALIGSV